MRKLRSLEGTVIPGAVDFLAALESSGRKFLILTNNSMFTARDLCARLDDMGLSVPEDQLWTSALATAEFVASQRPEGSAYVIGESGLTTALHDVGYTITNRDPDYVILGETRNYSFSQLTTAVRLVESGSRFLCTNPDPTGPSPDGSIPACGAVAAMIERATRISPYFVGKPNPIMMREGLNRIGAHSKSTVMIGDRMDTDDPGALRRHLARGRGPLPLPAEPDRRLGGRPDRRALAQATRSAATEAATRSSSSRSRS